MKRVMTLVLGLGLAACAPPMFLAGHTTDFSEVFTGEGVGGPGANWIMRGLFTGVTCSGAATPTGVFSSSGNVSCSDGRSVRVDNVPYQGLTYWHGQGTFPDGIGIRLYYDLTEETIKPQLERFKQAAADRRGGTPPSAVARPQPPAAPPAVSQPPRLVSQPPAFSFPRGAERPDDVAVIIGNADYGRLGRDIPNVKPAHADAEGMRLYATQALGIRDGNIIFLRDATGAQMTRVFGSRDEPRGQLSDWIKPGRSRVFVYYSGHGAPGVQGGSPYLVPVDADATRIELNGYPLRTLYDNLGKLPAESVTVVLEACFSGVSPAGSLMGSASPVFFEVKAPPVPETVTVIAASAASQMANWEQDGSSGLFTRHFLEGMAGKADFNRNGRVDLDELDRYLKETLSYLARRYYGRDQQAQIVKGGGR